MARTALITGITGQDGSYLAELLLEKGYEVHGLVRRSSYSRLERLEKIVSQVHLHDGDLLDFSSLLRILQKSKPDEVYNLAAQSFVPASWNQPLFTGEVTAIGVTRLLEAIREQNPNIQFFQASSSEIFGQSCETTQSEQTVARPRSPYGVAKAYGHFITINYRESFDMFAVSGILFNHESPRRGTEFVSRKISLGVAKIKLGMEKNIFLGNLDAERDWGHARDYVRAMWLMLSQGSPKDYVVATGKKHTVRDFARIAFECVGLDWEAYVQVDPALYRPAEVDALCGDASLITDELDWKPSVSFESLIAEMVESDLNYLTN
ncbi:MAG: GDP-mannose 4,6-dehydratase [Pirellulales bacterium]|nr:GDP-mannose 4,6-dehydratase [Pirellulales bacterium]